MVGFGSIGQGVLPLILRHIDMPAGAHHHRHGGGAGQRRRRDKFGVQVRQGAADAARTSAGCSIRCSAAATSC